MEFFFLGTFQFFFYGEHCGSRSVSQTVSTVVQVAIFECFKTREQYSIFIYKISSSINEYLKTVHILLFLQYIYLIQIKKHFSLILKTIPNPFSNQLIRLQCPPIQLINTESRLNHNVYLLYSKTKARCKKIQNQNIENILDQLSLFFYIAIRRIGH